VARWPDTFTVAGSGGWAAFGVPVQTRTKAFKNACGNVNPRLPLVTVNGGAVASYFRDATMGPVTAVAFAASAGSTASNRAISTMSAARLYPGQSFLGARMMRADRYTTITIAADAGAGFFFVMTLPLTPFWQLYNFASITTAINATVSAPTLYVFPAGTDGPTVYMANDMCVTARSGRKLELAHLSAMLSQGLFSGGPDDGALTGSATYDPPSMLTGASAPVTTVTVPGAIVGDSVRMAFSLDPQGVSFANAWVSAANTVSCIPRNGNTGTIDLASGTLTAFVMPA
jgi:hypothetical protein